MQHAVLLGRDSWMRFNTRSYRALLPRPVDNRVLSELKLSHHAITGVAAFADDHAASDCAFTFAMMTLQMDQGYGRGGTPVFTSVFEPLARVALYLTDEKCLGSCFFAA